MEQLQHTIVATRRDWDKQALAICQARKDKLLGTRCEKENGVWKMSDLWSDYDDIPMAGKHCGYAIVDSDVGLCLDLATGVLFDEKTLETRSEPEDP